MLNDANFFPFLMFSVFDAKTGEQRLLELNFVEDVLHDRFKDHCCRSYHFSMLKRVNKVVDQTNCIFNIEFNTEKHTYRTVVSTQTDFIIGMIQVAIEETQITLNKSKGGVNNPDNQNIKKDTSHKLSTYFERTENSLNLKCIMNDFVLPTRSVKMGLCKKKNATWSYS